MHTPYQRQQPNEEAGLESGNKCICIEKMNRKIPYFTPKAGNILTL